MSQIRIVDISGGMQTATTWQMRKANEIYDAENIRFDKEIGSGERRLGYTTFKTFSNTFPLGVFEAKFTTGTKIFYAYNDSKTSPANTILSYYDPYTGTSTAIKSNYPKNCKLNFVMNADELYVAGMTTDTGTRQAIINITNMMVVSSSRNLFGAPKAAFVGENSGALYAMNVELNGIVYPDRAYISSPQRGAATYVNATIASSPSIKLDSARYIKTGMVFDIYGAGTGFKKATITVMSVNNSTDTITADSAVTVNKTDELWLTGRFGDGSACMFWNTDYRSPQTADFLFITPGKTASTAINGWAKSNNRMNIFTLSSLWQYDNANFIPIFDDIGCISHDTICNNGTFVIWLDATGKVHARDSNSGQEQIISRGIKNQYLENLSSTNLAQASAVMYDGNYKLSVGSMTIGTAPKLTRFVYNFDMNIWWREAFPVRQVFSLVSSISGVARCYFFDESGNMYLDETGNMDGTTTIPWFIQYGRRDLGLVYRMRSTASMIKVLNGIYIYSHKAVGAVMMVKAPGIDNKWLTLGGITDKITSINPSDTSLIEARDFDFKISGNINGDSPRIEGIEVWIHEQQSTFS